METTLAFGKERLPVTIPDRYQCQVLAWKSAAPLTDAAAAIEAALNAPAAGPPLSTVIAGKKSAAISVCDITRPAPNPIVLPPLLKRLEAGGIPRQNITILIARPARGHFRSRRMIGPTVAIPDEANASRPVAAPFAPEARADEQCQSDRDVYHRVAAPRNSRLRDVTAH